MSVILLGLLGCVKKPSYPIVPVITFQSMVVNSNGSATLKVNFTDGDGDIGYPNDETGAPPDFILEVQQQDASGNYYTITEPGIINNPGTGDTTVFQYHIPDITPDGKYKALSGQIQIALTSSNWYIADNINERLVVWITDRAGHVSNRVITPAVVTP